VIAVELVSNRLPGLLVGLGLDVAVMFFIGYVIYYRRNRNAEYLFAFGVVNLLVFCASYLMTVVNLDVGVGFGLFALFAVMRFRTDTLPIQEMTYLFAAFVVAATNALAVRTLSVAEILVINGGIVLGIYALGYVWLGRQHDSHRIVYERIENIVPGRRLELIDDLTQRTGLDIVDVKVDDVNFLNDTAKLTVTAKKPTGEELDHPGPLSLEEVLAIWSLRRAANQTTH